MHLITWSMMENLSLIRNSWENLIQQRLPCRLACGKMRRARRMTWFRSIVTSWNQQSWCRKMRQHISCLESRIRQTSIMRCLSGTWYTMPCSTESRLQIQLQITEKMIKVSENVQVGNIYPDFTKRMYWNPWLRLWYILERTNGMPRYRYMRWWELKTRNWCTMSRITRSIWLTRRNLRKRIWKSLHRVCGKW